MLGIPRIDPATWENLPHNRCRQTLFLPWPRETPEKLILKAVLIELSRYPIRPFGLRPITMPSGSLIPDRQLTFSPELAETIGLEEAILLQGLGELLSVRPQASQCVALAEFERNFPFWKGPKIRELLARLEALGIIHVRNESQNSNVMRISAVASQSAQAVDKTEAQPSSHQSRPNLYRWRFGRCNCGFAYSVFR